MITLSIYQLLNKNLFLTAVAGWTGDVKLDASAITKILNGEMPTLGRFNN